MDWNWNWEAIGSFAAVAISLGAVAVALRANRLVGVYKRTVWTVTPAHVPPGNFGTLGVHLTNNGEASATNVRLTLKADPLYIWSQSEPIPLIGAQSSEVVGFNFPPSPMMPSEPSMAWSYFLTSKGDDSRRATVTWTDLEGRHQRAELMMPAQWYIHEEPTSDGLGSGLPSAG